MKVLVLLVLGVLTVFFLCPGLLAAEGSALETLALSDDSAPGVPGGAFRRLERAAINNRGEVLFSAAVLRGETARNGLWLAAGGEISNVQLAGASAPGYSASVRLTDPSGFHVSDSGLIAFDCALSGGGLGDGERYAIFSGEPGGIALLAGPNRPAPGDETPIDNLSGWFLHRSGILSLTVFDDSGTGGHYVGEGAAFRSVARRGTEAPGTGLRFGASKTPAVNGRGEIALIAALEGDGSRGASDAGIWAGPPEALRLVVRYGDPAPGTDPPASFDAFFTLRTNDRGDLLWNAFTRAREGGQTGQGLWLASGGDVRLIAHTGGQAPGLEAGLTFAGVDSGYTALLGETGLVAYTAVLAGPGVETPTARTWWLVAGAEQRLLARSGGPLPGSPDGLVVREMIPALNRRDQCIIKAELWNSDEGQAASGILSCASLHAELSRIIVSGETLEVRPGDARTVAVISARENLSDSAYALNDRGELAFSASFTDGSYGLFVLRSLEGRQKPGDLTQDAKLDLSDVIALLDVLFRDPGGFFPCRLEASNRALLDSNGDARVDLTDAVVLARHLFLGGPPPVLGSECRVLPACPEAAACTD